MLNGKSFLSQSNKLFISLFLCLCLTFIIRINRNKDLERLSSSGIHIYIQSLEESSRLVDLAGR